MLRFAIISLCAALVEPSLAVAQKATNRLPVVANVDDSGKLVPSPGEAVSPQQIGEGEGALSAPEVGVPSACPQLKAMSAGEARALVEAVAKREAFYPEFVLAVAKVESNFDVKARSDKGAAGLMQLEPATALRYKVDICDPADNVLGGVRFLRDLHDRYRNPMFILSAYNAGEDKLLAFHGIPPFPETVKFIANVLNEFYAWPDATAAAVASGHRLIAAGGKIGAAVAHDRSDPKVNRAQPDPGWTDGFVRHIE